MIEEQKNRLTSVDEIGEFGLIDRLTDGLNIKNRSTLKGVGDDAAVISCGNKLMLVSTDLLVENVHFDLVYAPLKHLGYKAAVVNFSDIYAMNGVPKQITVGIAVSSKFSVEAIEEIYAGIKLACDKYGVDLVGGDTTSSVSGLFISVTVVGEVDVDKVVYRSGAKVSDLLYVTGDLGAAYNGLLLLEREKAVFNQDPEMKPDLDGYDYLLERQLKPEARKDIVELFEEHGIVPTSMIDISDGLASEIKHICKQSDVGCNVYEDKIPIDPLTATTSEVFKILPVVSALNGGEDYELLFTIKQSDFEKLSALNIATPIGHITEKNEGTNLIGVSGGSVPLNAQGWDGLKKSD